MQPEVSSGRVGVIARPDVSPGASLHTVGVWKVPLMGSGGACSFTSVLHRPARPGDDYSGVLQNATSHMIRAVKRQRRCKAVLRDP